jgi:hypothetical protein
VRRGHHLDLRLEKFRRDAAIAGSLGGVEERLRRLADGGFRLRIDQEVFLLDPEREGVGHAATLLPRAGDRGIHVHCGNLDHKFGKTQARQDSNSPGDA